MANGSHFTMPCIGIDLGTSFCRVGIFRDGAFHGISDEEGNVSIPSYVSFTDSGVLVGRAAKAHAPMNPTNTVFAVERLIGRDYNNAEVQEDLKLWPFKVVNQDEKPYIAVQFRGREKLLSPEEILAIQLHHLKRLADNYLGQEQHGVFITVPASFSFTQRQAIKDSAKIAGLNVMRLVPAADACALTYSLHHPPSKEMTVITVDVGGSFCNVSLATLDSGVVEVLATASKEHAGGQDVDQALMRHLMSEFRQKYGFDLKSARALQRLRLACENAKNTLSAASTASIEIERLEDDKDLFTTVNRGTLEALCTHLFGMVLECVAQVMREAKLNKHDIHEVILSGGSTRLPKIPMLIAEFFNGKEPFRGLHHDEAAVMGAAIQAAKVAGDPSPALQDLLLMETTPRSLGVALDGGLMEKIMRHNSSIPCSESSQYLLKPSDATPTTVAVYEGENAMVEDNDFMAALPLYGASGVLMPAPELMTEEEKKNQVVVTMDVDANGDVTVAAQQPAKQIANAVRVVGGMDPLKLNALIAESKAYFPTEGKADSVSKLSATEIHHMQYFLFALEAFVTKYVFGASNGTGTSDASALLGYIDLAIALQSALAKEHMLGEETGARVSAERLAQFIANDADPPQQPGKYALLWSALRKVSCDYSASGIFRDKLAMQRLHDASSRLIDRVESLIRNFQVDTK